MNYVGLDHTTWQLAVQSATTGSGELLWCLQKEIQYGDMCAERAWISNYISQNTVGCCQ